MPAQVVTANRLRDGDVVYLAADGGWSLWFEDSRLAHDKDEAQALLARAEEDVAARLVVGPYLMPVALDGERLRPLSQREIIRARGPSVRLDLGKQAARAAAALEEQP